MTPDLARVMSQTNVAVEQRLLDAYALGFRDGIEQSNGTSEEWRRRMNDQDAEGHPSP